MPVAFTGLGMRLWVRPENYEASADFYRDKLGLTCTWRGPDASTFELPFGPTIVLETFDPAKDDEGHGDLSGRMTGLSLRVVDIAAAYETLRADGVSFMGAPEKQYWGGIMAFIVDPGGNIITLLQRP